MESILYFHIQIAEIVKIVETVEVVEVVNGTQMNADSQDLGIQELRN
jgi:hypothetical protein